MNAILAKNLRTIRTEKNWTQAHLADACGIQLRTIQRIESAQGASADTLAAISAGLGVSVELLQLDLEAAMAELRASGVDLMKGRDHVPMKLVEGVADLHPFEGVDAAMVHCAARADDVQDLFVGFQTEIEDLLNVWADASPANRLEWKRSLFEQVREFNRRGCVVGIGRKTGTLRGLQFAIVHFVVWSKGDEKDAIVVNKPA